MKTFSSVNSGKEISVYSQSGANASTNPSAVSIASPSPSSTAIKINYKAIGEEAWKKIEKVNGDLFAFTYGAFLTQIIRDHEVGQGGNSLIVGKNVNEEVDKIGYNIGCRIIDDFLARLPTIMAPGIGGGGNLALGRCSDFREVMECISKVAFKQFMNFTPNITTWSIDGKECILQFPLAEDGLGSDLVVLPEEVQKAGIHYGGIYGGVIRGALEMIHILVECTIINDPLLNMNQQQSNTTGTTYNNTSNTTLQGNNNSSSSSSNFMEMKVRLVKYLESERPPINEDD